MLRRLARMIRKRINLMIFRLKNLNKERFECPICGYRGPFMDVFPLTGQRRHEQCPLCKASERSRLQFLVVEDVLKYRDASRMKMLHCAPEPFLYEFFSRRFGVYESADLNRRDVDHNVDLQQLPFDDESYDFIFASHVLEHIPDDEKAISEIRRVLRPDGIAVLPVPVIGEKTVEYPEPNPNEAYHVRAPGMDYFDRFSRYFSKVEKISSESLPEKYQLYIYEDRSKWPTKEFPLRTAMKGERHADIVPVCYV